MGRRAALVAFLACLLLAPGTAGASSATSNRVRTYEPGASGVGDPYFPADGNGGYDVAHYLLDLTYEPATDLLSGEVTINARATQDLSSFNLDLEGLTVRSVTVDGRPAKWRRDGGELTVIPHRGLGDGRRFTVVVRYDGVPETISDSAMGPSGFFHTDDGALVMGEPDVAATWFPVNDHPIDKATYTFEITVPAGLEAVANGVLQGPRERDGWTTWTWMAEDPMASYLAMMAVGEFDVRAYGADGIRYRDAIDPNLFASASPRAGGRFAFTPSDDGHNRLAHLVSVPDEGGRLSFWLTRKTLSDVNFAVVEAHTVGQDDWTTLPDLNGHTSQQTGLVCPFWFELHPFLQHYQSDNGDETCSPGGSSGTWWAASGSSEGYEKWTVDLTPYAGRDVEVSISSVGVTFVGGDGLFVDNVALSPGAGTTSFEDDDDPLDGWTVPGAPAGSRFPNLVDWTVGTAGDTPPPLGDTAEAALARQPEIVEFLESRFGPYPFAAAGGIVDDFDGVFFALENQSRPIYSKLFFRNEWSGADVIVHELAHQWFGDSVGLEGWQHIWLNEGFATYAQWLWREREGRGSAQEQFDLLYADLPAEHPFWTVSVGDPGPARLLSPPVYERGAMVLHRLRVTVGDEAFFRILRQWARSEAGGQVTTDEFVGVAESVSGEDLDELFQTWLFTPVKPVLPGVAAGEAKPPAGVGDERRRLSAALMAAITDPLRGKA